MIFNQGWLLYIIVQHFCIVRSFLWWSGLLISFHLLWQMSMETSIYIGFKYGASCHTQHSASAGWEIYTPMDQVLSSGGVCLWPFSNNVAEYSAIIELLWDAISHGVLSLEVRLDLELILTCEIIRTTIWQHNIHTCSKN